MKLKNSAWAKNGMRYIQACMKHIALIYQKEGDSVNYYKYKDKTTQAYFTHYQQINEKKIMELRSELELQKTRDTIEMQKGEIESLKSDIQSNNSTIKSLYYALAGLGVLTLLILVLFFRSKKRNQQ